MDPTRPARVAEDRDTIAAVATPEGEGGLAVVRVSGPRALAVAAAVFRPRRPGAPWRTHRARLGLVVWPEAGRREGLSPGDALDQALALPLLAAGARPAGPGEFTRRAFLNGRLSLDQAEAVADLIHAEDELAARGSLAQLRGGLRREIDALEAPLLDLLARLEGALEFAEADDQAAFDREEAIARVRAGLAGVDRLLARAPAARRVREGVHVVLSGEPNSGKSALFNALLGEPRALVDPEPGTTRDVLTATLRHDGLSFVLHDTAGLREAAGRVEALGIARAREALAAADLELRVWDLTRPAPPPPAAGGGSWLLTASKADLVPAERKEEAGRQGALVTSAVTGEGLPGLLAALAGAADADGLREAARVGTLVNERHQYSLMRFRECLADLLDALEQGAAGEEVAAGLLAAGLGELGEITGRIFTERLLGDVFARFCVGK